MSRVHPGLRRRAKNARAALAERRWRADRQRWEAHHRGAMLAAGRALQAEPIESFDDDALLDHLDRVGDHFVRGTQLHFELVPVHNVPVGRFLLACRRWAIPDGDAMALLAGSSSASAGSTAVLAQIAAACRDGGRRAHEPRRRPFRRCGRLRGARRLPRRPRLADGDAVHAARPRPHRDPRRAAAGHPERGGTDRRALRRIRRPSVPACPRPSEIASTSCSPTPATATATGTTTSPSRSCGRSASCGGCSSRSGDASPTAGSSRNPPTRSRSAARSSRRRSTATRPWVWRRRPGWNGWRAARPRARRRSSVIRRATHRTWRCSLRRWRRSPPR